MTSAPEAPLPEQKQPAAPPRKGEAFVRHLIQLCATNAGARSALRRGDTPALADRALPYLASWSFTPAELNAAQLFAALLAQHANVGHDAGSPLGRAAFQTLAPRDRHEPVETGPGRRVVACQRQTLKVAHRTFSGLLSAIEARPGHGLDWTGLWRTYRTWDHPDPERRRATRQRLLLDFYSSATNLP